MEPLTTVEGPAAALPGANINTDVIMPKQFLKGLDKSGLDKGALHDLRFDKSGNLDPSFILNKPEWADARFLVVGPNFGCGSSREHAVWGLMQLGVRAIVGTSFAGIFNDNAANNGLLLVKLAEDEVDSLEKMASDPKQNRFSLDLPEQKVTAGGKSIHFDISAQSKKRMVNGIDPISATLAHARDIHAFEAAYRKSFPWLETTELEGAHRREQQ